MRVVFGVEVFNDAGVMNALNELATNADRFDLTGDMAVMCMATAARDAARKCGYISVRVLPVHYQAMRRRSC